jgi:hypothetical protein
MMKRVDEICGCLIQNANNSGMEFVDLGHRKSRWLQWDVVYQELCVHPCHQSAVEQSTVV